MLDTIAVDPKCSFRNQPWDSKESEAILDHFHSIMGKSSNYFDLNINTMFTKECYERILQLIEQEKKLEAEQRGPKPEIYMLVQCLEGDYFNPLTF